MTWFAFANDGSVYDLNGVAEKQLAATFAHGYATMQEAIAHKNAPANGIQAALLAQFVIDASDPVGGGTFGVIQIVTINPQGQQTGQVGPLNNPVVNASGVDKFLHALSENNTWVRVGEFVAGILIFYAGIKAITAPAGTNVAQQTAKQTASRVKEVFHK